ncbi:MAG: glycosyltransferase [Bacteroides sp.]|nr:glycosyltransferase [Bacteroides sp.]MCM1378741.1 glycosyltransferase [Bacteroides sp.]MCM1445358.1 glycosyltransferase [Prevotella sp.]
MSNFLNPHQYPLACELYRLTEGKFRFVETMKMPDVMHKSGYPDYDNLPWLIRAWESPEANDEAMRLAAEAQTMMYGAVDIPHILDMRTRAKRLTFVYAERSLKRGWINALSPNVLNSTMEYWRYSHNTPVYFLGASAFAAADNWKRGMFRNRCFRWGYFPTTAGAENEEYNFSCFKDTERFRLMSVCRMLDWKQPVMYVRAAKALKEAKIPFVLDMFGTGYMLTDVKKEIERLGLEKEVIVHGSTPNERIHREMQGHHCLLFASNKREGWGAVVNEAMGNGCVVIGSSKIGSVPYLIEHGVTGLIFRDSDQSDLNNKVIDLGRNLARAERIARTARRQMQSTWSPEEAAHRLLELADALSMGKPTPFAFGPCSRAPYLNDNWI